MSIINGLDLQWKSAVPQTQVYAVGDVRPVINSCANTVVRIPRVEYGIGALSEGGAAQLGEGIVYRGRTAITPAGKDAGTKLVYHPNSDSVTTPFFLGWSGRHAAHGRFLTPATLRELYDEILRQGAAKLRLDQASIVLVEIIGYLYPEDIHDRALRKRVDIGNRVITSPENQYDYFNAEIISTDLKRLSHPLTQPFPMAGVGIGYSPGYEHAKLKQLDEAVFYSPPDFGAARASAEGSTKTHTHALGWRNSEALLELLQQMDHRAEMEDVLGSMDLIVDKQLLPSQPSYIVHLDEWSRFSRGVVRVFSAPVDQIQLLPIEN